MEFIELIEKIVGFIPAEYAETAAWIGTLLPWLVLAAAAGTCFAGHKLHRIWTAFLFFIIFFFAGCFLNIFFPKVSVYVFIAIGAMLGTAAAVFSRRLLKLQLFCFNAILTYIAVSGFLLKYFTKPVSVITALVCGVIIGIIAMRYRYIAVILTTSVAGASLTVSSISAIAHYDNSTLFVVLKIVLAAAGAFTQCFIERKELKESFEHLFHKKHQ